MRISGRDRLVQKKFRSNSPLAISEVLARLDQRAPAAASESWDNVGLLVGDPNARTRSAVVAVDLTTEAIALAKKIGARLIVTHHACIFPKSKGLSKVDSKTMAFAAARVGINVVACHTNFDRCALEVVETVSHGLQIKPMGRLLDHGGQESLVKIVVFIPLDHLGSVRDAMEKAGAGCIGHYDQCGFTVEGQGSFRGGASSRPYLGRAGRRETVSEVRFETIVPRGLERAVVAAMKAAHPYEEVAYDLVALQQGPGRTGIVRGLGYGFWGEYARPKSFPEFARDVKQLFGIQDFWFTPSQATKSKADSKSERIKRVAFVAGNGSGFIGDAIGLGCDLLITGETGYHPALAASRSGMRVVELGHQRSERFFAPTMQAWLEEMGLKTAGVSTPTQSIVF